MSLKGRVTQIAQNAVKSYVATNISIANQQNTNNNTNLVGKVQSFDLGSLKYTIVFPDGSSQTVSPGGLRPIGPGDSVLVSNGAIIG